MKHKMKVSSYIDDKLPTRRNFFSRPEMKNFCALCPLAFILILHVFISFTHVHKYKFFAGKLFYVRSFSSANICFFVFVNKEMRNAEGNIDKEGKCY